jgi:hypothetical protein
MAHAPKKLVSNSARKATGASGSGKDGHCAMPALLIKRYTPLQFSAATALCLSPVTSNCNGDTPSKVILDGSRAAAYRTAWLGPLLQHPQGRLHLGMSIELGAFHIHDQTVAVLHHRVRHMRQATGIAIALAHQPGLGVCGRLMGRAAALFALEVGIGVARAILRWLAAALLDEGLVRGPGIEQRAIYAEMLVAGILGPFVQRLDVLKEQPRYILIE